MKWQIRIIGDAQDLHEIGKSFSNDNIRITKKLNNEYYLFSDEFQIYTNAKDVFDIAGKLLFLINGASRLAFGKNIKITLSDVVKVNDDGTEDIYLFIQDNIQIVDSVRIRITDNFGNILDEISPADDIPRWVNLGIENKSVAKVLRLFAKQLDWVGLYRIYEVIENDIGGLDNIISKEWVTKSRIKSFKHTSNSPGVTGDNARHGKETLHPPKNPMQLFEARNLVEHLIGQWLISKK